MRKPSVSFVSLGCPKNTVDSEKALGALLSRGVILETDPRRADWIVVNTCGFIDSAKRESVDTFLDLARRRKKHSHLVLAGCLSARYGGALAEFLPEAELVLGILDAAGIRALERAVCGGARTPGACGFATGPRLRIGPPHWAYLRIAEGCDNRCAYCAIPGIRGPLRSRSMRQILREARELADAGVRELVLVAQDTTSYGLDLYGERRLAALLEKLAGLERFDWIRLMYAHPAHLGADVINGLKKTPRVLHYLDLPFQHIDDRILKCMGRRVTRAKIERILDRLKTAAPDIAIRTTFIVGFPGETVAQFHKLVRFVREWRFDHVGVFAYSREEGTRAAEFAGHLKYRERLRRRRILMAAQQSIVMQKNRALKGKRFRVLLDGPSGRVRRPVAGRSYREAPEVDSVIFLDKGAPGCFVEAEIDGARGYDLTARVVREL